MPKHDINLIYLESRPSKEVFGEYNFFADIDRGIEELEAVLNEIKKESHNRSCGDSCGIGNYRQSY